MRLEPIILSLAAQMIGVLGHPDGKDRIDLVDTLIRDVSDYSSDLSGKKTDCEIVISLWSTYFCPGYKIDKSHPEIACCNIPGVICKRVTGGDVQVVSVDWYNKRRAFSHNTIPVEFGELVHLRELDLSRNGFKGDIPSELFKLRHLRVLKLYNNKLSGRIPRSIGDLKKLRALMLDSNRLSGEIPSEIGTMQNLKSLSLHNNQLSGHIPPEIGNLKYLAFLSIYNNLLTGPIPSELGSLKNLCFLNLASNMLNGEIPTQLGYLTKLETLRLNDNQLGGSIPENVINLPNLRKIDIRNNCFGDAYYGHATLLEKEPGLQGYVQVYAGILEELEDYETAELNRASKRIRLVTPNRRDRLLFTHLLHGSKTPTSKPVPGIINGHL